MWQVGTDKVSYLRKDSWADNLPEGLQFEALNYATQDYENDNNESTEYYETIPTEDFEAFANMVVESGHSDGKSPVKKMEEDLTNLFGGNYAGRFNHGLYAVVSRRNVLYVKYGNDIFGFTVDDPTNPSTIEPTYRLRNAVSTITTEENSRLEGLIVGLSMTYDGNLIVIIKNGIGIVDPNLETVIDFHKLDDGEHDGHDETISNSICVDENDGIYVASTLSIPNTETNQIETIGYMRKLVWLPDDPNGARISDSENDGAWRAAYETSDEDPPMIKEGRGTGSTPTLMGFGSDPDKLVVITNGAKQMSLLAFWRDDIPPGGDRLAGEIPVTCGLDSHEWIQSEQSVVVSGYGAFVVNNIPALEPEHAELEGADKILQVSLVGPAYTGPCGAERFEWDTVKHEWTSVWTNSEVSATSMVPIHSQQEGMVIVGGYNNVDGEWQLVGLSWEGVGGGQTEVVYRVSLGNTNRGNGAYSIPQYLHDGTLVFNSIVGPILVDPST